MDIRDKRDTYMTRILTKVKCFSLGDCIHWDLYFEDDIGGTVNVTYDGTDRHFKVGDLIILGIGPCGEDDACIYLI